MKKRMVALLLAAMACVGALTAGAAWSEPIAPGENVQLTSGLITPLWDNARTLTCILSISGKTASCEAGVTGQSGTTKITGTLTLYRQSGSSWVYVDSWSKTVNSSALNFSEEKAVTSGNSYKLVLNATVTRNGTTETVSKESAVKTCV